MAGSDVTEATGAGAASGRAWPPGVAPNGLLPPPGALPPTFHLTFYGADHLIERSGGSMEELTDCLDRPGVAWVDVRGLGDVEKLSRVGAVFDLHGLALEDILQYRQRPKVEPYEDHLFIVLRVPCVVDEELTSRQISLLLGRNYVVTFQDGTADDLAPIRPRLQNAKSRLRQSGPDYLAYVVTDLVIDLFFPLLEHYGEHLEALELEVTGDHPGDDVIMRIHNLRRELLTVRRMLWPTREVVNGLVRDDDHYVKKATRVYLRDCYDHVTQQIESLEIYREVSGGLIELYLSVVNMRTNDIMKVLTIIATIFIPLGWIAGVYGMNFGDSPFNMPELHWRYGYPAVLGAMGFFACALLYYFHRKGWITLWKRR